MKLVTSSTEIAKGDFHLTKPSAEKQKAMKHGIDFESKGREALGIGKDQAREALKGLKPSE